MAQFLVSILNLSYHCTCPGLVGAADCGQISCNSSGQRTNQWRCGYMQLSVPGAQCLDSRHAIG